MPLSLHPAAVTLVLKKLSLSGEKFICHFSTNTGSILSLLLRKEPDIYTSIIGAHYRQETEPDLGFFPCRTVPFGLPYGRHLPYGTYRTVGGLQSALSDNFFAMAMQ